jgi:protein-serine/threonine kinase
MAPTYGIKTTNVSLNDFQLLKVLGKGSYGKVVLVKKTGREDDDKVYAMKMLRKEHLISRNQVEHTKTERQVLESISHPFIVHLHYAFQTPKKLHLVLEYCPGGELFFHLSRAGRFSEERCKFYASEICLAISHLHSYRIIYRDLKPENLLLDSEGHLKLTDFGLSKQGVEDNFSATTQCGTPEYLAPEILRRRGHGRAVDWYSLGALMFEMLTGLPPYYSKDRAKLFARIERGTLEYPSYISSIAKALLCNLLCRDPQRRLGGGPSDGEEVKQDTFFSGVDWQAVFDRRVQPPFKPSVSRESDVKYFEEEFLQLPAVNSEDNILGAQDVKYFEGFSYTDEIHYKIETPTIVHL